MISPECFCFLSEGAISKCPKMVERFVTSELCRFVFVTINNRLIQLRDPRSLKYMYEKTTHETNHDLENFIRSHQQALGNHTSEVRAQFLCSEVIVLPTEYKLRTSQKVN